MAWEWKKSDLIRLAIVVFVLAVVISGNFGYGEVVAVRTTLFFASLALFWLSKVYFYRYINPSRTWMMFLHGAIWLAIFLACQTCLLAAIIP